MCENLTLVLQNVVGGLQTRSVLVQFGPEFESLGPNLLKSIHIKGCSFPAHFETLEASLEAVSQLFEARKFVQCTCGCVLLL